MGFASRVLLMRTITFAALELKIPASTFAGVAGLQHWIK